MKLFETAESNDSEFDYLRNLKPSRVQCFQGSKLGVTCEALATEAAITQARFADAQSSLAWAQIAVSLAALVAALLAAFYTRNAVLESRRIGEAQTRAYVSINNIGGVKTKNRLGFNVEVMNAGQSPALNVKTVIIIVDPEGKNINLEQDVEEYVSANENKSLSTFYYVNIDAKEWSGIVLKVKVIYKDVFGRDFEHGSSFAGSPNKWTTNSDTVLMAGTQIASYLRSGMFKEKR